MSIFNKLIEKYKQSKQKSEDVKKFKKMLFESVADGSLTQEEIFELERNKEKFGISDEEIKKFKIDTYLSAFHATKADGIITSEEEDELKKIQEYLKIPDESIITSKEELSKLRLLNEIQNGNIPEVQIFNLIKQKGEKAYWSESGNILEEKVIKRGYVGSSQGVSFRIMKGVSYRIGSQKGQLVTETGILPISAGDFVITNKRIIFRGDCKSFAIRLDKILDVQCYSDGIKLFENNKSKPRLMQFHKGGNGDIVGSILSYSINNYN